MTFYLANFHAYKFSQVDYKFLEVRKIFVYLIVCFSVPGLCLALLEDRGLLCGFVTQ